MKSTNRKTIVIFSAFYAPFASGAERFVEEVGGRLSGRFRVVIITSRLAARLPRRERQNGCELIRVGLGVPWDKFLFPILAPLAAWRMAPTLVHAVMESYAGIALLFFRLIAPRTPTILTLQSGDLDAPERQRTIPQWLWRRIHTTPHRITAISNFLAARAKRLGVPSERVRVIPNGVDLQEAESVKRKAEVVPGRIVCVGRLSWEKGQSFLIEALPDILKERPEAHLVLVGDGAEREALKRLVAERGLRDKVRFTGTLPREEALRELSQASVAALPSLGEGLGIAAIEAQAVGVPIVASNVGGIPDMVTDEETGLLVPPRDSAALASAILRLMRQPELPARLTAAAREQLPRFDWDKIAQNVGELYDALIPKAVAVQGPVVLIATGIYPPDIGGPAKYAETLMEELPKRGVQPLVLTYGEGGDDLSRGIYRVSRAFPPVVRHKLYAWRVWRLGRRAQAILALDTVSAGLPAVLANVFLKKRLVVKVVGDYAWEQGQGRFGVRDSLDDFQGKKYGIAVEILRVLQRFVVRHADAVLTPSEYLAGIVRSWDPKNVRVVYNAVPASNAGSASLSTGQVGAPRFPGKDVILSAGRMVPWKGFATLIGLMPELLEKNPKFHLAILGDGPERQKLEELIRDLHVNDSVTLVGRVSHAAVGEYLREANVFVLNSGYEGLSHVLLEAMAAGVSIAASTAGGNKELLEASDSKKAGLGFPYNNREEIKRAIIALASDPELRRSCIEAAREKVAQFIVAKMVDGALTLLLPERELSKARVLMVSLDSTILDTDSPSWRRMVAYASAVENLTVLVLAPGALMEKAATKLRVIRAGGLTKI
ncbi:MAG: glycosyltransferase family 4 protein, partial [Patescibacteria group bacterium]